MTVSFFLAMTLGAAILGSCGEDCSSPPFNEPGNFRATPIELIGSNGTGEFFEIATYTNQVVRYDSLGIELTYELAVLGATEPSFSFIKSAMACDPRPPYDYFREVSIFSDSDYNEAYPAGTNLSDIIRFSLDLKTRTDTDPFFFAVDGAPILITFVEAPDQTTQHQFTLELALWETGTQTAQVAPVTIKP